MKKRPRRKIKPTSRQRSEEEAVPSGTVVEVLDKHERDEPVDADEPDEDDVDPALSAEFTVLEEDTAEASEAETPDPVHSTALVRSERSLAVSDPLQAYINETRRYPLLNRQEEHDLAVRFHEQGDLTAARQLVTANLRLVVKIAHEYRKGVSQPAGPGSGRKYRSDACSTEIRSLSRRQTVDIRIMVDPRVHFKVYPQQLAPRKDWDHPGAAQAFLQSA